MLYPIFKNQLLQKQFEQDGFIVIRKLLPSNIIDKIRALYKRFSNEHLENVYGMHTTSHASKPEMLKIIYSELLELTAEYGEKYLCNYKFYLGNFFIKESRNDSLFNAHQDWNCVDEPDYCSLNLWMSLEKTNAKNGHLFFIKGSHRIRQTLRISPQCPTPWDNVKPIFHLFYTYVDTEPGDVIFLNNACLHGSTINYSGKSRISAALGAHSDKAQLLHYYLEPGASLDKVEKHIVTSESLINMIRGQRPPDSRFDGYVTYNTIPVEKNEFIDFMFSQYTFNDKLQYYFRKNLIPDKVNVLKS